MDEDGQAVTVTSKCYTEIINEFLAAKLPPNQNLWFQQYGSTAHTALISLAVLRLLFPQRVISRFGDVPRPPRSPDLTATDFDMNMSYRLAFCKTIAQLMSHNNRRQFPRRK